MPESSDIAITSIRPKVVEIRRQNSKAIQRISLPNPTAFPAREENISQMNERLAAVQGGQDSDKSE